MNATVEARAVCEQPAERNPSGTFTVHRAAVERAIQAMHQRLSDDLSLDEMAEIACMSPYHFNRVFRRLTGIPPSQFLSALRLEAAKRLLLTTDLHVTDICYEVGYNSLGTFTTRFTQLVGLAPGQLRLLSEIFKPPRAEDLLALAAQRPLAEGPVICGRLEAPRSLSGLCFVGLFERPIPQERPVGCTLLGGAGSYRLEVPAEGTYHVFAAAFARPRKPLDFLLCGDSLLGVASAGPLSVEGTRVEGDARLLLRAPDLLDPPFLVTLPMLIDERLHEQLGPDEALGAAC